MKSSNGGSETYQNAQGGSKQLEVQPQSQPQQPADAANSGMPGSIDQQQQQPQQPASTSTTAPTCKSYYTVCEGDTCASISAAYHITTALLFYLNPNLNCEYLTIGQKVCIPSVSYFMYPVSKCENYFTSNLSILDLIFILR